MKSAKRDAEELRTVIVPRHDDIAVGTLRSVVRQAGLSVDEIEGA